MKKIVNESYEVPSELQAKLNSVLSDEFLSAEAYRIAEYAMAGKKQHLLEEVAEENGKDELEDHFKNLCEWMQSKGIKVVTSHKEMEQITNCTPIEIEDGESTVSILEKLILSEVEAISVYEDIIPETKLDLKVMLAGFLKDEREHLKALMDIRAELGGTNIEDMEIELDDDEPEDEMYDESVVINERELDMGEKLERVVEPEEVATVQWLYMSAMDAGRKTAIYELEDLLGDRANDKEIRDILDRMKDWIDSGAHSSRSQAISDGYARSARTGSNLGD